jgi:hypothetical protein
VKQQKRNILTYVVLKNLMMMSAPTAIFAFREAIVTENGCVPQLAQILCTFPTAVSVRFKKSKVDLPQDSFSCLSFLMLIIVCRHIFFIFWSVICLSMRPIDLLFFSSLSHFVR